MRFRHVERIVGRDVRSQVLGALLVDSPQNWAYSAGGFPVVDRTVSPVKQVTAFIGTRLA